MARTNTRRKVDLYILSLGLLFLFFIIMSIHFPDESFFVKDFKSWNELILKNILTIISLLALIYCFDAYRKFDFDLKGTTEIPFEIRKIDDANYEHLTFLATYVVPLISFNFSEGRQVIVLILLLVVMGAIYVKTDLFYANPSLALLGFRIYRANGNFKTGEREGIILISRTKMKVGTKVSYIKLDDRIYFVKGLKDES
ncbi:anti-phage protein KwaA [Acinetobacter radioresistens]|uniref:anti-phage protein KwaA n=1 Tax=Acinetobacter TaxID=469 RepID=UPI00336C0694